MDGLAVAALDDADMADSPVTFPVKKYDITGSRLVAAFLPLVFVLEPLHAVVHPGELRDDSGFDIAALVRAPADERRTPRHMTVEPVPTPELLSASVSDLCGSYLGNLCVTDPVVIVPIRIVPEHMGCILLVAV